jgi:Protein of unknown function (DUF3040)
MHRPRPVTLTEAERRALRVIETALAADDPALSGLLTSTAVERPKRRTSRMLSLSLVASALLLVLGLVANDAWLTAVTGLWLLTALCLRVMVKAVRQAREPPPRPPY